MNHANTSNPQFLIIQYLSLIFHNYMSSTSKTGLWTTIPYACMWGCSLAFSLTSDLLIRRKILSTTKVRKVMMVIVII